MEYLLRLFGITIGGIACWPWPEYKLLGAGNGERCDIGPVGAGKLLRDTQADALGEPAQGLPVIGAFDLIRRVERLVMGVIGVRTRRLVAQLIGAVVMAEIEHSLSRENADPGGRAGASAVAGRLIFQAHQQILNPLLLSRKKGCQGAGSRVTDSLAFIRQCPRAFRLAQARAPASTQRNVIRSFPRTAPAGLR